MRGVQSSCHPPALHLNPANQPQSSLLQTEGVEAAGLTAKHGQAGREKDGGGEDGSLGAELGLDLPGLTGHPVH